MLLTFTSVIQPRPSHHHQEGKDRLQLALRCYGAHKQTLTINVLPRVY